MSRTNKYDLVFGVVFWFVISLLCWYFTCLKQTSLDFHTRDYAYYSEFIVKWGKPQAEQKYSINPGGYNILGISTADGCAGFYQWVHFEPFRIFQALIYWLTGSMKMIFLLNAMFVCSPIICI